MKRIGLAFIYLFAAYLAASLSFITLSLYPDFATFGLDKAIRSLSYISFFPLSLIFLTRSLMEYFSERYCKRTRRRFFVALLFSAFASFLGVFLPLAITPTVVFSALFVVIATGIFVLPDLKAFKHFEMPKAKGFKSKIVKKDKPKKEKVKKSPTEVKTPLPVKKQLDDVSAVSETVVNKSTTDDDKAEAPFVLNTKTKKRVLPDLHISRHVQPMGAVDLESFGYSGTSSKKSLGADNGKAVSSDESARNDGIQADGGALDELQTRVNYIKEFEQKKRREAILRERQTPDTAVAATSAVMLSDSKLSSRKSKLEEDELEEDEVVNDVDDDDDEFKIEIDDTDGDELIYSDDEYDDEGEDEDDFERKPSNVASVKVAVPDRRNEEAAQMKRQEEERRQAERAEEERRKAEEQAEREAERAREQERKAAERAEREAESEREAERRAAEKAREQELKAAELAKEAEMRMGVGRLKREDKSIREWHYEFPPEDLLIKHKSKKPPLSEEELNGYEAKLIDALNSFQIEGTSDGYVSGPTVTLFKIELAPGVKVSRIISVSDDIARFMGVSSSGLRIIPTIEGTHDIGIEMPNPSRQTVSFIDTLEELRRSEAELPFALGKSVTGEDVLIDIAKTPHLLLAGSSGSGKSVSLNSMVASLLYVRSPESVRFIIVDPKQVELELYNGIPHLLTPVITDPRAAIKALDYCVEEMERRYTILSREHVRNIKGYNDKVRQYRMKRERMPYIVVIIDEFADLMQVVGKDLEQRVSRLAAKARAIGMHLVLATQRPSVDVVTGTLKNNIPTRVAFRVASAVDSKTILDQIGAEKLLGNGDMLLKGATNPELIRIQGSFLSDGEVEKIIEYVKSQDTPDYIQDDCLEESAEPEPCDEDELDYSEMAKQKWSEKDERLLQAAWDIAMEGGGISTSYLQRRLRIGYNLAATIVDEMSNRGIIGPSQGSKKREIIKFKD